MRAPSEPRSSSPGRDGGLRDLVAELAFPRAAGGAGERRVAEIVAAHLASAGLDVHREEFRASRSAMGRLRFVIQGTVAAGTALYAWLLASAAPEAWLVGVAAISLAAGAGRWRTAMERAFDVGPMIASANIVARRRPARPVEGEVPHRLVFLAHLDSKSSRVPTFWTSVIAIAVFAWLVAAEVACAVAALGGEPVPSVFAIVGYALACAVLLVTFNPSGDDSPGAMDNAAGLAVLIDLARTLPEEPDLASADLTFLATGAEELGLCGAMRWIQAHEAELDRARTVFVNVDSVGVGRRLLAVDVRGRSRDGRPLKRVLRDAACAERLPLRRISFLPGVGVDTMPISARGFATASIVGDVLGGAARRIHSRRDTLDHVDEAALRAAARLVRGVARELVRDGR